ncbi:protein FAM149B1 isoform X2 [Rhinatrema bivittatum]|uniref:protein FAM149B1 isoform X2 n=1 Tax=Rhinatrema bivittatum TaxID=194408 RepID=UPI00112938D7|nr:protein FAM149B1 isoform X2 [Rhinatrema bivittatum]
MISRYRRKPVIQSPESHGFVKSDLEAHPLPERLVESSPGILSNESYYTGSECKSESEISGDSRCLTVAVADGRISWWNQQSCTGLSTEGSSVLSWGFDEFDGAATRQVQQIFQHIDELLYEQKTSILTTGLQEECQQWSACFPHLRIQGKQILIPAEDGYGWYFSNSSEISVSSNLSFALGMDSGRLGIFGTRLPLSMSPVKDEAEFLNLEMPCDMEEEEEEEGGEEVIVSEGIMEEYLAFDFRDMEEELHEKSWALSWDREEKQGYPPISPLSCKKMAVFEHLFDDIWREVVCCTADLVHRHWEGSALDAERNDFSEGMSRVESFSPFHQFEPLPLLFPRVPTSKMPFIPSNLMNRPYGAGSGPQRNLNGLMIIHSIPLQQKNLSHMDKMQDCDEKIPVRSAPGVFLSSRAWPSRPLEHSTSSVSHSAQSSRRRNPPRTLHPISTNPSRSSTPKSLEEVVRGIRLPATTDQLPCSPAPLSRNNLLPPISSIDLERSSTLASRMQTIFHFVVPTRLWIMLLSLAAEKGLGAQVFLCMLL